MGRARDNSFEMKVLAQANTVVRPCNSTFKYDENSIYTIYVPF